MEIRCLKGLRSLGCVGFEECVGCRRGPGLVLLAGRLEGSSLRPEHRRKKCVGLSNAIAADSAVTSGSLLWSCVPRIAVLDLTR